MDGWPHINRLVARECMWTDSGVRWQRCVREVRQARAEARATLWYVQPAYAAIQRHQRRGGVKMRPRPLPRRRLFEGRMGGGAHTHWSSEWLRSRLMGRRPLALALTIPPRLPQRDLIQP